MDKNDVFGIIGAVLLAIAYLYIGDIEFNEEMASEPVKQYQPKYDAKGQLNNAVIKYAKREGLALK